MQRNWAWMPSDFEQNIRSWFMWGGLGQVEHSMSAEHLKNPSNAGTDGAWRNEERSIIAWPFQHVFAWLCWLRKVVGILRLRSRDMVSRILAWAMMQWCRIGLFRECHLSSGAPSSFLFLVNSFLFLFYEYVVASGTCTSEGANWPTIEA